MNAMTTTRRAVLIGMGAALVLGIGAAGVLAQGNDHPAMTAAHPTPLPTATTTIRLPGATTTITPPAKVITKYLPQATKTITKTIVAPRKELVCKSGKTEDSCWVDYIGKGRWVLREGERPSPPVIHLPKATKKVPQATTYKVCSNPRITKAMVADCNHLAARPKVIDAQGNETPNGRVLVAECIESYDNALELAICLAPPSN
jgi:hypothetical protein